MANIHKLFPAPPPRRTYFDGYQLRDARTKLPTRHPSLYDSLKDGAEPQDYLPADLIRRRVADEAPDLYETLRKAGYRRTWRDDLDDYLDDWRCATAHHVTTALLAVLATLACLIAPFAFGRWF